MRHFFLIFSAAFLLISARNASAQLVWEQKVINLRATSSDPTSVAHFKYKNAGDYPIRIIAVVTSCGCTTAKYPKEPLPPGATGEIVGTFDIGGRKGFQPRTITVETDDQKAGTKTVLEMITTISELLRMKPTFVEWDRNEALTPKKIDIEIMDEYPIKGIKAISANPAIQATVETITPGKQYTVTITPVDTGASLKTIVSIAPEYVSDHPKQFMAHVRIK